MPLAKFGEKTIFDGNQSNVFKLETKGQQITLRFLGDGYYDGKHFLKKDDGGWDVFYCPRIQNKKKCMYCEKMFEARKTRKEELEKSKKDRDQKVLEEAENEIKRFSPNISFYYPILDRDMEVARILQTVLTIRNKLEEEVDAGINVLKADYVLTRTQKSPAEYYSLVRLDSNQSKDLSPKEKKEVLKATSWKLDEILNPSNKSSMSVEDNDSYATPEEMEAIFEEDSSTTQ
jgi:hypothetical protein